MRAFVVGLVVAFLTSACGGDGDSERFAPPVSVVDGGGSTGSEEVDTDGSDRVDPTTWPEIATTFEPGFDSASDNPCVAGRPACGRAVADELRRRLAPLRAACAHEAVFAAVYLQMTEATVERVEAADAGAPVAHLLAYFAGQYLAAYDAWVSGDRDEVPGAWQAAFEAAEDERLTGMGDAFLGMNAHISRDLPFALEAAWADRLGPVEPDGYVMANAIIERLTPAVIDTIASDYDATAAVFDVPFTEYDAAGFGDAITAWRSEAWDNANRLAGATTPAERDAVVADIESSAAARADVIATVLQPPPLTDGAGARRRHCEASR